MDPDFAYAVATDRTRDPEDRLAHALALQGWLARGGYPPAVWGPREAEYAAGRLVANVLSLVIGDQIRDSLDLDHIEEAALWASAELARQGYAVVELTPGDATRYEIAVIENGHHVWQTGDVIDRRNDYIVSLVNLDGRSYPWAGQEIHPGYATSKWVRSDGREGPTGLWTGTVLACFLNCLAEWRERL